MCVLRPCGVYVTMWVKRKFFRGNERDKTEATCNLGNGTSYEVLKQQGRH